jgi:hypothetical protein
VAAEINVNDLGPEVRRKLGVKKTRQTKFSAERVRGWSLRILGQMAGLTRQQRARVLRHALRVNKV